MPEAAAQLTQHFMTGEQGTLLLPLVLFLVLVLVFLTTMAHGNGLVMAGRWLGPDDVMVEAACQQQGNTDIPVNMLVQKQVEVLCCAVLYCRW